MFIEQVLCNAKPIIDKFLFIKAISVIDKLSPITFSDKCCRKFSMRLMKFYFCRSSCKILFLDFSRKESSSPIVP